MKHVFVSGVPPNGVSGVESRWEHKRVRVSHERKTTVKSDHNTPAKQDFVGGAVGTHLLRAAGVEVCEDVEIGRTFAFNDQFRGGESGARTRVFEGAGEYPDKKKG